MESTHHATNMFTDSRVTSKLTAFIVASTPERSQQLVQALAGMREVGSVRGAHTLEPGLVAIDGGHVDVLLTDHDLPGDDGATLARHAQSRLPDCKVLTLDGGASGETVAAQIRQLLRA